MLETIPAPEDSGIDVYESPARLKNLRALSQADTGAANSEKVQLLALMTIGFRSEKDDKLGLAKPASAWKLGMKVNAPKSIPAIMTGLRPTRSDSAPKNTTSGVPRLSATAKIIYLFLNATY